jgi:hypothetical protein
MHCSVMSKEQSTKWQKCFAQRYPIGFAATLPLKRRAWESEDYRMDIFDAVALAVVFRLSQVKRSKGHTEHHLLT